MRLYVTDTGAWAGTQAEARQLLKDGDGRVWEQVEVPTDKERLLGFLNAHRVKAQHAEATAMAGPPQAVAELEQHRAHCFQGEYATSCKYGDACCPAQPPRAADPIAVIDALPGESAVLKAIDGAGPRQLANIIDAACDRLLVFKGAIPGWLAEQKKRA